ncbi:mitotic checkpoint regulator, MAD2B-interacting-domain-containing protein [Hypoxylon fragiforme]|uniref:mitotic checkpoint regulator, MAD2B-interacting-domain-containing protein n=1 Tax=Hypoxylon fragiforme TaxID=63214 RepID=UPI0020C5E28B|nr:mitotic checkpoint regulator, MAD2B-interacting-domain-containing protein [Hypoxylon fragiforme]KAI2612914.1 mitotic checkpoint regulator, MAD2B-interacting-domain-containing protein [Hypoxylon fragiforme]
MGLVDYSDSESDSEAVANPAPSSKPVTATASGKKPFRKVVDRSKPGKILINLSQSSSGKNESETTDGASDGLPSKRAKIGGGGGAFSGFNSLLPPPKNAGKPSVGSSSGKAPPRPGVNLKTGSAPGFSREVDGNSDGGHYDETNTGDADVPTKQPSIPAEQKPADEVKLVGKPLMFKPLSVSRKSNKKNTTKFIATTSRSAASTKETPQTSEPSPQQEVAAGPPAKKQKISLFSIPDEATEEVEENAGNSNGAYEPMFDTQDTSPADEFAAYDAQFATSSSSSAAPPSATTSSTHPSLDSIASEMNLSATARRELFGRRGAPDASMASSKVVMFDTDREYAHNEQLRASGQQQAYNPVRSIATGGKHNLRQLVTQAQTQREALEESFAKGKNNRNEAGSRYGWR